MTLGLLALSLVASEAPQTIYVSKLGANTDGRTWETAFTTLQAALDAVSEGGGRRIVVRPDTYMEANLAPAQPGAAGAWNELVGDVDGKLGSGTSGWVVIDSGDPGQQGFKSYDWWAPIRAYSHGWSAEHTEETFSAIVWDRWRLRHLYATGGDAGLFFDGTNRVEPFSVVVEDCVSIGRAFGGGVGSVLSRPDEPITYRRSWLCALDTWGDTAAGYFRVENQTMPERPDVLLEDCALVSQQCALKGSNYGFHTATRVALRGCRLIVNNFSQPVGEPSKGVIQSVEEGKHLAVELTDCLLMGYKLFGVMVHPETAGEIQVTTHGDVRAYVQYQQEVPAGIFRLPDWPVEAFAAMAPPDLSRPSPYTAKELVWKNGCELSPFLWHGRLCHMHCQRPPSGGKQEDHVLIFRDAATGEELGRCGQGYSLASCFVWDDTLYVYASRWENGTWNDVTLFRSKDLRQWEPPVVVVKGESEGLFNSSVCRGRGDFVMAYESNEATWPAFTTKFARSKDLVTWTKLPRSTFGTNRYTACPCIRHEDGWYYVLYLEHRTPRWRFETYITRSKDLESWELSRANPVIAPTGLDEGINASDPELVEVEGKTWLYYATGDQRTWADVKRVAWPGKQRDYLKSWFKEPGIPDWGAISRETPGSRGLLGMLLRR